MMAFKANYRKVVKYGFVFLPRNRWSRVMFYIFNISLHLLILSSGPLRRCRLWTWTYPPFLAGGGRWRPELALVSLLCVLCGLAGGGGGGEGGGIQSPAVGGFSALSGQQLQHLLPLSGNHTGCYCSRQRWGERKKRRRRRRKDREMGLKVCE